MALQDYLAPRVSDELRREEESHEREIQWFLTSWLPRSLAAVKSGLDECMALLAPDESASSTLALSSPRSEAFKGYVVRRGASILKGEIQIRTSGGLLRGEAFQFSVDPARPLELPQIADVVDMLVLANSMLSFFAQPLDGSQCGEALRVVDTLLSHVRGAVSLLQSANGVRLFPHSLAQKESFVPALPANVALDLSIKEAAVFADFRLLEVIRSDLLGIFNRGKEDEETYAWGEERVRVRERIRVEAQDPALMAILSKLLSVENSLELTHTQMDALQMDKES